MAAVHSTLVLVVLISQKRELTHSVLTCDAPCLKCPGAFLISNGGSSASTCLHASACRWRCIPLVCRGRVPSKVCEHQTFKPLVLTTGGPMFERPRLQSWLLMLGGINLHRLGSTIPIITAQSCGEVHRSRFLSYEEFVGSALG